VLFTTDELSAQDFARERARSALYGAAVLQMIEEKPKDNFTKEFDIVVIGAGINGAGIARDAAMRGLDVLLLDKGDIAGGTSSWSTRLIHGGLRYLEHGEFGLVRESLRERETLFRIAPHLVRPLPLLIPIYKRARRGRWMVRAGMFVYDVLSFDKALPLHQMLSPAQALERAPGLDPSGLIGAALYYDAQVEFAERLVLENALSAIEHGAKVITYARVDKFVVEGKALRGVEFTDQLKGESQIARAKLVINAAGPWVDEVLGVNEVLGVDEVLGFGQLSGKDVASRRRLIGGTKGSHIIVAPFAGAPGSAGSPAVQHGWGASALYIESETDHRPFFIIPWNGNYLIGTTDTRFEGDLDRVQINDKEIDYLLRETNRLIPRANLTRRQILYTYSGIRPLAFSDDKDEQRITRRHFIRPHAKYKNLFSIVGGKLTTYRSLAEQTVDLVLKKLNQSSSTCTTAQTPLPGANTSDSEAFEKDFKQHCGLPEAKSDRLLRIYGTRSLIVSNLIAQDVSLAEVFDSETGAIAAEIVFAFKHELARKLSDCLLRRTMVGLNSTCGLNAVEAAGRITQKHLAWSENRIEQETAAYRKDVARFRLKAKA
jgi:glycerol-3-phosphate dehydrogenase